jgi:hypothetical protein
MLGPYFLPDDMIRRRRAKFAVRFGVRKPPHFLLSQSSFVNFAWVTVVGEGKLEIQPTLRSRLIERLETDKETASGSQGRSVLIA